MPRRRVDGGVLPQDRPLELLQGRRRLDAERLDELAARAPVGLERIRLPAGAVEGEHQLRPEALAIGVLAHELLELGHERVVPPAGEVGVQPPLERAEPQLLEAAALVAGERKLAEVGQRRAAPELERRGERRRLVGRPPRLAREQLVDAVEVELARLQPQPVGAAPGLDPLRAERPAVAVHGHLEGVGGARRRALAVLAALAAGVVLGSVSLASASPAARGPETLTLVAVESGVDTPIDVGARGDSLGDGVYFVESLYRAGRKVGRTDVVCHFFGRSVARCSGTLSLAAGRLEAAGTIRFSGRSFSIPVLGGTGTYAGASGVLRVTELGETRSRY